MQATASSSGALGDIVFGNPFSAERAQGIVRLVPGVPLGDLDSNREALARVVEPRGYCSEVRSKTGGGWSSPSSTCAYHRCTVSEGPPCVTCRSISASPFAGEALAQLLRGDVSEERAGRVFGFFFQLRRAFYFIHRSLAGECES